MHWISPLDHATSIPRRDYKYLSSSNFPVQRSLHQSWETTTRDRPPLVLWTPLPPRIPAQSNVSNQSHIPSSFYVLSTLLPSLLEAPHRRLQLTASQRSTLKGRRKTTPLPERDDHVSA